jgi:hypothetical protein
MFGAHGVRPHQGNRRSPYKSLESFLKDWGRAQGRLNHATKL